MFAFNTLVKEPLVESKSKKLGQFDALISLGDRFQMARGRVTPTSLVLSTIASFLYKNVFWQCAFEGMEVCRFSAIDSSELPVF